MPKINPEKEAEKLREEIERKYPPSRCSLEEYREVLDNLRDVLTERIVQIDDELG